MQWSHFDLINQSELIHTGACSVDEMEVCATFTPGNRIALEITVECLVNLYFNQKEKKVNPYLTFMWKLQTEEFITDCNIQTQLLLIFEFWK